MHKICHKDKNMIKTYNLGVFYDFVKPYTSLAPALVRQVKNKLRVLKVAIQISDSACRVSVSVCMVRAFTTNTKFDATCK